MWCSIWKKRLLDIARARVMKQTWPTRTSVNFDFLKYYIETLVKKLGLNTTRDTNSTNIPCTESFDDILSTHANFVTSVGLEMSQEDKNLPYLYWTPKPDKTPFKHRFIAGSSKCTTKDLSWLLKKLLSTIKDGLIRNCATKTSRNGVNSMWILKNSICLLYY